MFNVLPEELKKEVASEYSYRRVIVISCCVLFLELCLLILFMPSLLISSYKEQDIQDQIQQLARSSSSKNIDFISLLITTTNAKLSVLDSMSAPRVVPIMDKITSNQVPGIRVTQMTYQTQKKDSLVVVGGVAASRDALVVFVKNLRSSDRFKKVDVPLSNFAEDTDIHFVITLTLAQS